MKPGDVCHVGSGVLSWNRNERVSDRYGTINLSSSRPDWKNSVVGDNHEALPCDVFMVDESALVFGCRGILFCVVTGARRSGHIGDIFHGVFPSQPEVGEAIVLGEGTLFCEKAHDASTTENIGVRPDGREVLWMDIHALYRCHEQTVDVYFEVLP